MKGVIALNKIKGFIKKEAACLKKEISVFEYILCWLLRTAMVAAIIYKQKQNGPGFSLTVLILSVNLLATFTVPLIRLLLFPKRVVCRLPFGCQRWINVIVFFAAFLGHTFDLINEVTGWDKLMHFMSGAVVLLLGSELADVFIREKDKVSDSFRILTATGFSFFAMVLWEIYEFIVDYNWPGSTNMAYSSDPDRDPFFIWLFGGRSANFEAGFAGVFDTVIDMLCAVAGAIPAIIFLVFYLRARDKKAGTYIAPDKTKVRFGGIKGFIKSEIKALKEGITLPEYIFWWVLRIGQTVMLVYRLKLHGPSSITVLIMTLNLIATFAVPLVRILLFPKRIFCKVPFRCQSWINFIIIFASFLSHGFNFSYHVTSYDKFLHVMMGAVAVLIGNELITPLMRKGDKASPLLRTLNASGFSFFAIVIWEVYEFFIDYYWPESGNMAYRMPENNPFTKDPFFVKLYGGPSENFSRTVFEDIGIFDKGLDTLGIETLFDTLTDMICATAGIIPVMIILWLVLKKKESKQLAPSDEKEAEEIYA